MNISLAQLKKQYERAKSLGWLAHFQEAASTYNFPVSLLLAIGSRETNLDSKWLQKLGDGGHGAGLLQVDIGTDKAFITSGKWKDAREGIIRGAQILSEKREQISEGEGQVFKLRSSKGQRVTFTMPRFTGPKLTHVVVAAYNSGLWAAYHASKKRSPDYGTTGADYGQDVLDRAAEFQELIEGEGEDDSASSFNQDDMRAASDRGDKLPNPAPIAEDESQPAPVQEQAPVVAPVPVQEQLEGKILSVDTQAVGAASEAAPATPASDPPSPGRNILSSGFIAASIGTGRRVKTMLVAAGIDIVVMLGAIWKWANEHPALVLILLITTIISGSALAIFYLNGSRKDDEHRRELASDQNKYNVI
jgi:hypothetical protein